MYCFLGLLGTSNETGQVWERGGEVGDVKRSATELLYDKMPARLMHSLAVDITDITEQYRSREPAFVQ